MTVTRLDHAHFDWASGAGGADVVRRVAEAAAEADGREALNEAAVLTLRNHGLETGLVLVAEDTRGAARPRTEGGSEVHGGRLGGFAYVHGLSGGGRPELDLVVAPGSRGQGLGAALVEAVIDAVDGIPLTAWSHGNHPAAARLAARHGFEAVRELWLMRRRAGAPLPDAPVPAGYAVRPFRPGEDDAAFLAVNAEAFADHPEQGRLDQRGLDERTHESWFDPAGFLVGVHEGRLDGFHWTKVHPAADSAAGDRAAHGEVYVIGVHPRTQGTGLGRALLAAGLTHLHGQGLDEVVLYVEGDNHGAVRLYERFGFTHAAPDTDVMYLRA